VELVSESKYIIILVNYNYVDHFFLDSLIRTISNIKNTNKRWTINIKKINIDHDKIYIKSKTLDKITNYLKKNNISKTRNVYYIKSKKKVNPHKLKKLKWMIRITKKDINDNISVIQEYPLYLI
jgi:hypothetical protein